MTCSRTVRVLSAAVLCAAASGMVVTSTSTEASTAVGPNQAFIGRINGSTGSSRPVTIAMACFGAVQPGQTGHPLAGQTVAVRQVPPTPAGGMTGSRTTSIGAFFGAPPPAAPSSSTYVDFTRYGRLPMPTSLTLPCSGSGHVIFVALPLEPGTRSFSVPITFAAQP